MYGLKLTVEYDGTNFHGWQIQANRPALRTVQGVMQERLRRLTGEELALVAASRTDAGVHARGQVVKLVTAVRIPVAKWPVAANSMLPPDMAVRAAEVVPEDFDPVRQARAKTYTYTIYNHPARSPLLHRYTWHVPYPLDVAAMHDAAALVAGTHDFSSFCAAGTAAVTRTRRVSDCRVTIDPPLVRLEITASGYLYHMVRIIAGTLGEVGRGKYPAAAMADILAARDRSVAGPTAPACGLCLERVEY